MFTPLASGSRASGAIKVLQENGFVGRLYNGQGVNQWTRDNYELVNTPSVDPPCKTDEAIQTECKNAILAYSAGLMDGNMTGVEDENRTVLENPPADELNDKSVASYLPLTVLTLMSTAMAALFL